MIILVHSDHDGLEVPDAWHTFSAYTPAAVWAQRALGFNRSDSWITRLDAGVSQWRRPTAEEWLQAGLPASGVCLEHIDLWPVGSNWRARARFEAGLVQIVDDLRYAGIDCLLTVKQPTYKRRFLWLRRTIDLERPAFDSSVEALFA